MEVGLKLLMQLVGGLSAAVFTSGDKVLAEDGAVAVDDDEGKGRRFLGWSVPYVAEPTRGGITSQLTAAVLSPFNSFSAMRCSFSQIMALRFSRSHSAHFSR